MDFQMNVFLEQLCKSNEYGKTIDANDLRDASLRVNEYMAKAASLDTAGGGIRTDGFASGYQHNVTKRDQIFDNGAPIFTTRDPNFIWPTMDLADGHFVSRTPNVEYTGSANVAATSQSAAVPKDVALLVDIEKKELENLTFSSDAEGEFFFDGLLSQYFRNQLAKLGFTGIASSGDPVDGWLQTSIDDANVNDVLVVSSSDIDAVMNSGSLQLASSEFADERDQYVYVCSHKNWYRVLQKRKAVGDTAGLLLNNDPRVTFSSDFIPVRGYSYMSDDYMFLTPISNLATVLNREIGQTKQFEPRKGTGQLQYTFDTRLDFGLRHPKRMFLIDMSAFQG